MDYNENNITNQNSNQYNSNSNNTFNSNNGQDFNSTNSSINPTSSFINGSSNNSVNNQGFNNKTPNKKRLFLIIVGIILIVAVILGVVIGGGFLSKSNTPLDENNKLPEKENSENNNDNSIVGTMKFWYDRIDWDSIETKKNPEFKIYGISSAPFNPYDFKNHVTKVSAYDGLSKNNKYVSNIQGFDEVFNDNVEVGPFYTTVRLDSEKLYFTDTKKDTSRIPINDLIRNQSYYYEVDGSKIDEFLDIDMTDSSEYENSLELSYSNVSPLLDRVIEKFGKPTEYIEESNYEQDINGRINKARSYILNFVFDDYTISLDVYELITVFKNNGDFIKAGDEHYNSSATAKVYTSTAWQQYLLSEKKQENVSN